MCTDTYHTDYFIDGKATCPDAAFDKKSRETCRDLYQERGLTVIRIEEELSATGAAADVAGPLGLVAGAPVMLVRRTAFSFGPEPVEVRHRSVVPDIIPHRNSLGLRLDAGGRAI